MVPPPVKRLILRSFQSPGDVLMLTAAVRDLHRAHPGKFQTDVRTSAEFTSWMRHPLQGERNVPCTADLP
jgi:ADP-heptose:LPS heptosyltransferase